MHNFTSHNAEPIYRELINQFDSEQALRAILSFNNSNIASRLQFSLCQKKYHELLDLMKIKVSEAAVKELVDEIEAYKGSLENMREDTRIRRKVAITQRIIS